jgi:hypothetical protein
MVHSVNIFLKNIEENVFNNISVYRSLFITNKNAESVELKRILDKKNYNSYILYDIDKNVDYNIIENRIIIMEYNIFEDFINCFNAKSGIFNSSYNFIAFNYTINNSEILKLIDFYLKITNNNIMDTVIMDSNYEFMCNIRNNII